jgi:anaerobic magnesium-protoporphyrin IX monomethyl ester cyclase
VVGPEVEENLSLRYLAASLADAGYRTEILSFNGERDFSRIVAAILGESAPLLVGLSLAFQHRAQDFLALAMALRERGYPYMCMYSIPCGNESPRAQLYCYGP